MSARGRKLAARAGLVLAIVLAIVLGHGLAARALIDHGVAGALLAGGGRAGTLLAAAGFLLLRLACFAALAAVPAAVVWRSKLVWPRRASGRSDGSV